MPTPVELARIVEQYDEAEWYEFLDELDAVSRRRRGRHAEADPPAGHDRDALAAWIARRHLLADSSIREVWYLPDDAPADEIRLIEVNDRLAVPAREANPVEAIEFALDLHGNPFRLFVADVSGDEIEDIRARRLPLPPGWTLRDIRSTRRRD